MSSCQTSLKAINCLIACFEDITQQQTKNEEIVTPDWAKEKEIETKDCSCRDNKTKKDEFPFDAAMSIDNFNKFVMDNIDLIKEKGNYFIGDLHDKRGLNLLHCACINDCDELIEILISKYHLNINEVDIDGYSPLFYCVNQWSDECVAKLLLFKPRLDLTSKDSVIHATGFPIYICGGKTIIHQCAETNSIQCCQLILHHIKQFHSNLMIEILFKTDFNGFTAMDIARMHNKTEILFLLNDFIRNNIDKNKDNHILKLLNDSIDNKQQRNQQQREYHMKVRERIKKKQDNKQKQEEMNIAKHFKPKYGDLFFQTKEEYFPLHLLDKTLLKFIKELKDNIDIDMKLKIVDKYKKDPINFLEEGLKGIYSFRVFNDELCDKLLLESENYINQSLQSQYSGLLPIKRPNSMNSYGLVLNDIGMTKSWNYFIKEIIKPLSDILIPPNDEKKNEWNFKSHHTFLIRYKHGEDINLDTHIDASDVTLNVCIGKHGFEGANVYYHAIANSKDDLEKNNENYENPHPDKGCKYCRYEIVHKIGYGVLNVGNYIHGAKNLTKGERSNIVIWCKQYDKH